MYSVQRMGFSNGEEIDLYRKYTENKLQTLVITSVCIDQQIQIKMFSMNKVIQSNSCNPVDKCAYEYNVFKRTNNNDLVSVYCIINKCT